MGVFDHSSRSAFVRSGTDVGREGLARSFFFNSSQRCSIGLRSRLSRPVKFLIHVFTDLALCPAPNHLVEGGLWCGIVFQGLDLAP